MTTISKYFRRKPEPISYPEGPGGREVCQDNAAGKREYFNRTRIMDARQKHLCAICGLFMVDPTFDHQRGRGFGAGFRDDRVVVDGKWHNAAVHFLCNGAKGSSRYAWRNGQYLPVFKNNITTIGERND